MRERLRLPKLFLLILVGCAFYAKAFADAGSGGSSGGWGLTWLIPWVPVVSAMLALAQAIVAREMTVDTGFWHDVLGHTLLTAFGAVIGAATSYVANGQFTKQAAIAAIAAALGAFGGAWKTAGKDSVKMSLPGASKVAALLFFCFFATTFAGCPKPVPNPNGPNTTQQYDAAFGQCMKQKGLNVAVNDGTAIWKILDDPNTDQNQKVQALEALGITTAAGALTDLASCALYAWDQINPMAPGAKPTPGQAARRVFLSRHATTVAGGG
jgi:hypothetical protein